MICFWFMSSNVVSCVSILPLTSSILCPYILLCTYHHLQSRQGRQQNILNWMVESIPLI
jgi:hypothetical protein